MGFYKTTRFGRQMVVLKRLENAENANKSWFEEVCNLKHSKVHNILNY
jgi:hypothetical protein